MKPKALLCWSGGKDSSIALYKILQEGSCEVTTLLSTICSDYDHVSMHGVRTSLLRAQAESIRLPLVTIAISADASEQEYEEKMKRVLTEYKSRGISVVIFGDIFLEDLRQYRVQKLSQVNLDAVFPVWKQDTRKLAEQFIDDGFKAIVTAVDSHQLDGGFVGRSYDKALLSELPPGVDPCGENGEFHTFVYDGPIFSFPVECETGRVVFRKERFYYCDLIGHEDNVHQTDVNVTVSIEDK